MVNAMRRYDLSERAFLNIVPTNNKMGNTSEELLMVNFSSILEKRMPWLWKSKEKELQRS
jgi:hypothetical protein